VTFTATVSPSSAATGTVNSGVATYTTSTLGAGSHSTTPILRWRATTFPRR
jgi:hypothetical protein